MKIVRDGKHLIITKEKRDPQFRDGEWGSGESRLLYHIKKQIINGEVKKWGNYPTDFIKKRMCKDAHLVSEEQLYLRSRKFYRKEDGAKIYISIRNTHWQIRGINDDFNEDGKCSLYIEDCTIGKINNNLFPRW